MQKIKEMVDANTIIGDAITVSNGTVIIPVSKVSFGFASGGSDFPTKIPNKELFGGGSGAGVTISPVAFLVIGKDGVKLIQVQKDVNTVDKVVEAVPNLVDKVTDMIKNRKSDSSDDVETAGDDEPLTVSVVK